MDKNIQKFLPFVKDLGLKEPEAIVYLALVQLGQASVGEISRLSGIQRTYVYVLLDDMAIRGIVTFVEARGTKQYSTISVDQLRRRYEIKLSKYENALPELRAIARTVGDKPKVKFFEGKEGIFEAQNDTLDMPDGSEILAYYTGEGLYQEDPESPRQYIKERLKKKIKVRAITHQTPGTMDWARDDKIQMRESRIVPAERFPFANEINIYGDKISILSLQGELIAVIIESESVAKTQRAIFELAWEGAGNYSRQDGGKKTIMISTVKALIARDGKVLLTEDEKGKWEMPGGRIEDGESVKDTLGREIKEELGVELLDIDKPIHDFEFSYAKPDKAETYLFKAQVYPANIGKGTIVLSPEHQNYRWFSPDETGELNMQQGYKDAIGEYFKKS
jgi:sugar-specific transcriptional regulator TrmB/8-oxo-dGTP pyrophosphatase MutT (NUDIX family)